MARLPAIPAPNESNVVEVVAALRERILVDAGELPNVAAETPATPAAQATPAATGLGWTALWKSSTGQEIDAGDDYDFDVAQSPRDFSRIVVFVRVGAGSTSTPTRGGYQAWFDPNDLNASGVLHEQRWHIPGDAAWRINLADITFPADGVPAARINLDATGTDITVMGIYGVSLPG